MSDYVMYDGASDQIFKANKEFLENAAEKLNTIAKEKGYFDSDDIKECLNMSQKSTDWMTTKTYEVTFKMEIDEDLKALDAVEELLANFDPHPGCVRTYEVSVKDLGRVRIIPGLTSYKDT